MSRHIAGFTTPDGLYVGIEYMPATRDSDGYLVALYPDSDDYPESMDHETMPDEWVLLAHDAISYALTGGN